MMLNRVLLLLGMAFGSAILVAPPGIPIISAPQKIILGDTVTMFCNVTGGEPIPSVIWYRDNVPIDNTSSTFNGVTVNTLTFTATHDEHLEVFECQTDNRITQNPLSRTKFVEVYVSPQPPTLTGPTILQAQSTGTWQCTSILGYPTPSMSMRIGNTAFNNQVNFISSYDATSKSYTVTGTLVWAPTSANNGQTIYCDVFHPETSRTNTPQTVGLTLSISSPFGIFAPGTLYKPMVGDTVVLNCIITSGSATQIQWFVNGERIIISARPRFAGGSVNNPSLTITQVQESDRGSYICQGSDGSHTVNTSAISLEPRAPLAVSAPLTQYNPIIDEPVALNCVITSGTATQIRWFKNNVPVDITNNARLNGAQVGNPTLTITQIKQSDAGVYVCEAFDGVTRSTTSGITVTPTEKVVIIDDIMLGFMDKYNKLSRPATNDVPIVRLTHYLNIIRIEQFEGEKLVLYASQGLSWNDPRLQWTGEPKRISLPSSVVWTPDIVPLNEDVDQDYDSKLMVTRDGNVSWFLKGNVTSTRCSMKAGEIKECIFNFQLWTYDEEMVDLNLRSNGVLQPIELTLYEQHPGYEIVSTCAVRKERLYTCCAETFPYLQYTIVLKERTKVYPDNATCTA